MTQNKLVFVVGLWRSGTSLLHAMLNLHPQIALMFEAEPFVLWPPGNPAAVWPADWPQKLDFLNQVLNRHDLDASRLPRPVACRDAILAMFQLYASHKGANVMGGKAPAYHAMLPEIQRIFPEASFIIIWRNPEDCCRSALSAGKTDAFFAQSGIQTRLFFGTEKLAKGVECLRTRRSRVHELLYADLVAQPEMELRSLCRFLEIPFDARMLKLEAADLAVLPVGRHHDGVRSGVISPPKTGPSAMPEKATPPLVPAKVRRYAAFWRERYRHLGLARVLLPVPGQLPPGKWERLLDGGGYFFWRNLDRGKFLILRHTPLAWWRLLRGSAVSSECLAPRQKAKIVSGSS